MTVRARIRRSLSVLALQIAAIVVAVVGGYSFGRRVGPPAPSAPPVAESLAPLPEQTGYLTIGFGADGDYHALRTDHRGYIYAVCRPPEAP